MDSLWRSEILSTLSRGERRRRGDDTNASSGRTRASARILFSFYSITRNTHARSLSIHTRSVPLRSSRTVHTLFVFYYSSPAKFSALFSKTLRPITALRSAPPPSVFLATPFPPANPFDRSFRESPAWFAPRSIFDGFAAVSSKNVRDPSRESASNYLFVFLEGERE